MSQRNDLPEGAVRVYPLPSLLLLEPSNGDSDQSRIAATGAGGRAYAPLSDSLKTSYEHFPALLDENNTPWQLGNLFLLSLALENPPADTATLMKNARTLAHVVGVLNDKGIGLLDFPKHKADRATYAYHLFWEEETVLNPERVEVANNHINRATGFYRWMKNERGFVAKNSMWKEKSSRIQLNTRQGFRYSKEYIKTDLGIPKSRHKKSKSLAAYSEKEQLAIMAALQDLNNPEMTLAFLSALITGGRLQSILTMQLSSLPESMETELHAMAIGDTTTVDSKNQKQGVLYFPKTLVEIFKVYISSERYKRRAELSLRRDNIDNYVFLTKNGRPYYAKKSDPHLGSYRTLPKGKSITAFIRQQLEPKLIELETPLKIRYHNLRATFGNNFLAEKLVECESGLITYTELLYLVCERLGQSDISVTERYIEDARRNKIRALTQAKYENHIQAQIERLFGGTSYVNDTPPSGDPGG